MIRSLEAIEIPPHIRKLRPYHPGKPISEVQREHGLTDIIKLASNESPVGPSPHALAAMREACAGVALYPDDSSYDLRHTLAKALAVDPGLIIFGNGSDEIIHYLGLTYLQPGDEVVQATPTFSRYEAAATMADARLLSAPLKDFRHDLDAMARLFTDRTRLVFVANPNNPTGTMNTAAELERLLERLPDQAILVLDEAYAEYVEDDRYPDALTYIREGRSLITLRTFSKIYALAGLRVGYGVAPQPIIAHLNQVREPFNVNSVAQAAATASLLDPEQVERSRRVNREGMAFLEAAFRRLQLAWIPSVANFIMVETGRPAREVCAGLERQGVIVRSGEPFGMANYIRVTVGTGSECERFVQALERVLAKQA